MEFVKSFVREEEGQDVLEYGLLMAFIAVVAYAAIQLVGTDVNTLWGNIQTMSAAAAAA